MKPVWLLEAEKHIGQKEIKGPQNNSFIVQLWKKIKRGGIKDDETPWCAAFVGGCLEDSGIVSSRFESAASYLKWGVPQAYPLMGCIVVFTRVGGGHVGFVAGQDSKGNLVVLGGNQGDSVKYSTFPVSRASGYRWPVGQPITSTLLVTLDGAELSKSEA